jgi:hypothetical protein
MGVAGSKKSRVQVLTDIDRAGCIFEGKKKQGCVELNMLPGWLSIRGTCTASCGCTKLCYIHPVDTWTNQVEKKSMGECPGKL